MSFLQLPKFQTGGPQQLGNAINGHHRFPPR
jgi:hypothetical protein